MVMVQVVAEWSEKWWNLKSKKRGVNLVTPSFDFKVNLWGIPWNGTCH